MKRPRATISAGGVVLAVVLVLGLGFCVWMILESRHQVRLCEERGGVMRAYVGCIDKGAFR